MPLRQGSSDKVIQENIKCILDKDGCGYDPPYKDPAREEYTPAQAAAIAYAKAGRRNNVGKKTSASKKTKSVKPQELKVPEGKKDEPKGDKSTSPAQSAKKEKETDTKNPANNIQIPDGWKAQQPGGDTDSSKKNQPPEGKTDNNVSPKEDKYEKLYQDNKDLLEKAYGGNNLDVKGGVWDVLDDKMKQYMLDVAPKIVAEKEKKQQQKPQTPTTPAPEPPAPASAPEPKPELQPEPQQTSPKTPDEWNWDPKKYEPQLKGNKLHYQGNTYTQSDTLEGSTAPKLYSDEEGNPAYVVKDNKGNEAQVNAEYVSNKIYNELASHFPSMAVTSRLADGKLVNKYIKGGRTLGDLSPKEMADLNVSSYMKKSLLADALLANWDFAGLYNDNLMVDKAGNIIRIDTGGTFNFKATGGPKNYTPLPMEVWSLKGSEQGSQFWGDASEDDYKQLWLDQTDELGVNADNIRNIINKSNLDDNLKATFNKRLQAMIIAGQEAHNFVKNNDPESWQKIDEAIKMAFANSQQLDPNSIDWEKRLRSNIQKELKDLIPKPTSSSLDFDLISQGNFSNYFNEKAFKAAVSAIDSGLNSSDADEYGGNPEALKKISPEAKYGLYRYSGSFYKQINPYLWGLDADKDGKPFNDSDKAFFGQMVEKMDEGLAQIPDSEDKDTFFRMNKIETGDPAVAHLIDAVKNLQPGDTYSLDQYASYTDDHDGDNNSRDEILEMFYSSFGFNFITIYKGKNVKNIAPISQSGFERESLMQRGKQCKVLNVEEHSIKDYPGVAWGGNEAKTGKVKVLVLGDAD